MYDYHDTLKATHPYSSKWWEWPIDYVPIAYFYQDHRKDHNDPNGCCVYEITSLPNPVILWFGLLCVPWVAVLAWRERNKGYALIVITYLLQWLPWMRSPRITFAYHFYVDIPLICLCNVIVLQRLWQWSRRRESVALARTAGRRRVRRRGGAGLRLLLSDSRGASDFVERLAPADVVPDLDYRSGLAKTTGPSCPGHSKWHNIKLKKGKVDAQRGALFTKLSKEIILAAKGGSPDPEANYRLKMAVEKAREFNMPQDNIKRAIARSHGSERRAPKSRRFATRDTVRTGLAVVVDAATDNRNRTAGELRFLFSRHEGTLGESGSVAWMFDAVGVDRGRPGREDPRTRSSKTHLIDGVEDVEYDDELAVDLHAAGAARGRARYAALARREDFRRVSRDAREDQARAAR